MINEMATVQTDLKFDNHIKDYATNMKTTFNSTKGTLTNINNNTTTNSNNKKLSMKAAAAAAPLPKFISSTPFLTKLDDAPKIMDCMQESPMQMFYKDKGVFLTGGTGFFGKIIIEKLLRVTEVGQIFLLIRTKKGKDVQTRLDDIFNEPVFEALKKNLPYYREKITVISGDVSLPALGISADDRELLRDQVNIIIHGAATVRFDEKLKIAIGINVNGTKEILRLAKEIVHLKAVVHVSTAFAHCNRQHIEEKYYSCELSGDKALQMSDCLDEQTMNILEPTIVKDFPNTYAFTKVLAEDIVHSHGGNLPITIFRPGIVITTYREPVCGWIDNMYGPCGIIVGVGSGVLRIFSGKTDHPAHMVPVDMCVNALLTSAWDIARNTYDKTPIYNYIPDPDNIYSWRDFMEYAIEYGRKLPMRKSIWYPVFTIVNSSWQFSLLSFFYHTLPALFMDMLMLVIGKKPRMLKIYRKIHKFCGVMEYFSSNKFIFDNDNVRALWDKLDATDKRLFAFDMRQVDWTELFRISLWGVRSFVVKDDPSTIQESVKRHQRLKILHYTTLGVIYALSFFILYQLFKFVFL